MCVFKKVIKATSLAWQQQARILEATNVQWEESRPATRVSLSQKASLTEKTISCWSNWQRDPSHSSRSAEQEILANPALKKGSGGTEDDGREARS